jgi:hypothetical protein
MLEGQITTYPLPPTSGDLDSARPRKLMSLRDPPEHLLAEPPSLPEEAVRRCKALCTISEDYVLSTHLVPAAYPRSVPFSPPSENLSAFLKSTDRAEKKRRLPGVIEEVRTFKEKQSWGGFTPNDGEQRVLWNCVNRYQRKAAPPQRAKRATLFLTHANGFPKEVSEVLT